MQLALRRLECDQSQQRRRLGGWVGSFNVVLPMVVSADVLLVNGGVAVSASVGAVRSRPAWLRPAAPSGEYVKSGKSNPSRIALDRLGSLPRCCARQYVALARRKGERWHLGRINGDASARPPDRPVLVGEGAFSTATIADGPDDKAFAARGASPVASRCPYRCALAAAWSPRWCTPRTESRSALERANSKHHLRGKAGTSGACCERLPARPRTALRFPRAGAAREWRGSPRAGQ
jgi:hypothetical protein